jgi:hypothetical protein
MRMHARYGTLAPHAGVIAVKVEPVSQTAVTLKLTSWSGYFGIISTGEVITSVRLS